jgi:hypothetical protein
MKAQIQSKLLGLSIVDQLMRLMEGSITGMKDCSWSINCSAVAAEIMICRAEELEISVPQPDQEKTTNYHKNH